MTDLEAELVVIRQSCPHPAYVEGCEACECRRVAAASVLVEMTEEVLRQLDAGGDKTPAIEGTMEET